jgi:hypothetical protein
MIDKVAAVTVYVGLGLYLLQTRSWGHFGEIGGQNLKIVNPALFARRINPFVGRVGGNSAL